MKGLFTLLLTFSIFIAQAQNFTSGNLVVLRVGDGTTALGATSAPVSLVEYATSGGSATKTLAISSTGTDKLTVAGTTTGEGQVSLSQNGLYLCLLGYDQLAGASSLTAGTKVIGRIDNAGAIDLTTKFPTSANGSVRTAFSDNGLSFWTGINNFGYVTLGQTTTPTQINGSAPNRVGAILNNQLYSLRGFSDLFYTTPALPTSAATTATAVSLSTKLSANGFVFFDMDNTISWNSTGYDLLYISNSASGLEKYYYDGTYWKAANSQYNLALTLTSGGSGYTSPPSVIIGTAWASGATYAVGDYATNVGNLYIVTTAGTAGTVAPTGTATSIPATGGTAVFSYVAANATATATISGGVVTNIGIITQSGYLTTPSVTITGGGGSGATAATSMNNHVGAGFGSLAQMTGKIVGGKPTLYALSGSGASTANKIYAITDNTNRTATIPNNNTQSGASYTTIATAAANYAFRGIAFSPTAANALITITGSTTPFTTETGLVSAEQSYTVEGSGLSANMTITAPTGFEISTTTGSGFAGSLVLTQSGGVINPTTIFVRLKNVSTTGTPSGNITHTSTGAVPKTLAVSGTVVPTTQPVNYYVSPLIGSNSNDGLSPSTPFQTLNKFSNNTTLIKGGDVIYLMNGTFGATDLAVGNTGTAMLEITRSGEAGKPIKFTKYAGHNPLIQFNSWNAILVKASYIEIDGLKIRGANSVLTLANALNQGGSCNNPSGALEGKYNGNGIFVDGRILNGTTVHPTNVTIKNCEVYECGGGGIATTECDYLVLENNKTYNCAWYSIYANSGLSVFHAYNSDNNTTDYKHILRNNISYGNEQKVPWPDASCQFTDGNGIIIDDFRNTQASSTIRGQVYTGKTLVENNVVYNNGGRGVHAYYADNCTFINNTSYNNNATTDINEGEITIVSSNNCRVFSNILYARTGKKGNSYSGGAVGLQSGNNIIFNYTGGLGFGNANNGDMLGVDPKFTTNGSDFTLQSTSPAVDAGSTLTGLFSLNDILGSTRPYNAVRADMGAYESVHTGAVLNALAATVSSPNNMICSGEDAIFNIIGTSGATLTYKINTGSNTNVTLTGGAATVTIPAATASQTMTLVSITSGGTTQTFASRTSQVTVAPSVGGTIDAVSAVCAGTNRTGLTLINHRGIVLRWESSLDNFATAATPITSSLTTYYVDNLTMTTYYRAVLQNENCPTANSAVMPIIVNVATITGNQNTVIGSTTALIGSGTAASSMPWVSATPSVATVSNTGVVTGVAIGSSIITYTDNNGCTKTATVNVSATLPVELLNFSATPLSKFLLNDKKEVSVKIEWQTAAEKALSHYEVERSADGKTFEKRGEIKAKNQGDLTLNYTFIDEKPHFSTNYYRLKMVDKDGSFTYSTIKTASIQTDKTTVSIFPNPTSDAAYLTIVSPNEATGIVKLYNTNGQIVKAMTAKLNVGETTVLMEVQALPSGLYLVQLQVGEGVFSMKMSKN